MLLLQRLAEHFAAAVFSTRASKSFDAVVLVVFGAMAALGDHVLRQRGTDSTSIISEVLRGEEIEPEFFSGDDDQKRKPGAFRGLAPFGLRADVFYKQSESLEVSSPELHLARAAILDYFEGIDLGDSSHVLFAWEDEGWTMAPSRADMAFSDKVAKCFYKLQGQQGALQQVSGADQFLVTGPPYPTPHIPPIYR